MILMILKQQQNQIQQKQNKAYLILLNKHLSSLIHQLLPLNQLKMNNAFDYYDHLRKQQIHINKIINPQIRVPKHQAFKPIKPKIQETRLKQRMQKQNSIQRQNMHIMKKLFNINMRKPAMSLNHSTPSLSLPSMILQKRAFQIPQHERENNIIAQKLVNSKSSINVKNQLKDYHAKQKIRKSLSKYHNLEGYNGLQLIDRKKYIAELMMLKKMKLAEQTQSRVRNYISNNNVNSRVSRLSQEVGYHSKI